jgi:cell pole-organizing protein PopZ
MDLNNKNGQPSMEEILASIRRIIAEEPTAANPVIDLHAKYRNKAEDHDETNDFELPSIFRPAAPAPERQPLFGRLTDAIRSASGNSGEQKGPRPEGADPQERYRGALRESGTILALSNGQGGLDGVVNNGASHANGEPERYRGALRDSGTGSLSSALSSLKLARGAESSPLSARPEHEAPHMSAPAAAPAPTPVAAAAPVAPAPSSHSSSAPSASGVEDVRRVMVPFKDMRMSRMSTDQAPSGASDSARDALLYSTPSEPVHHALSPDFPAPPLQETLAHVPPPPQQAYEDHTLSLDDMHRFAPVVEQPQRPPPPPQQAASESAGAIEDTTADLLRPMLRQWLSENMPRMVEKALSIELAESVKSNRKFNGS